jgi:hypothetical protein
MLRPPKTKRRSSPSFLAAQVTVAGTVLSRRRPSFMRLGPAWFPSAVEVPRRWNGRCSISPCPVLSRCSCLIPRRLPIRRCRPRPSAPFSSGWTPPRSHGGTPPRPLGLMSPKLQDHRRPGPSPTFSPGSKPPRSHGAFHTEVVVLSTRGEPERSCGSRSSSCSYQMRS